MKKIYTITFLIFVGGTIIWTFFTSPIEFGHDIVIFNILWGLLAIVGGFTATFFTASTNERNAKHFEWMYKKTSFSLFKNMAEETRSSNQFLVSRGVGIIFIVIGLIQVLRYLQALVLQ